jgi:DNA polymerase (family X)
MDKKEVAFILDRVSQLMELKGENLFKVRAYQRAARAIEAMKENLMELYEAGKLTAVSGIGKSIAEAVTELLKTGKLSLLKELEAEFPQALMDLYRVPGLGPKKIKALFDTLHISSLGELEYACQENHLIHLPGFGLRSQEKIIEGIQKVKRYRQRHLRSECESTAQTVLEKLLHHPAVQQVSLAGSLRRGMETVKNIDVVAATDKGREVAEWFQKSSFVESILETGETGINLILLGGINLDLRLVSPEQFPHTLQYLTGSKGHNIALQTHARGMGFTINEYGLSKGDKLILCQSEKEIYGLLGLAYIEPELREDMGEIEAAIRGKLPRLITAQDIRGTFHAHTQLSDGISTFQEMAEAAKAMGLTYLGITEHSQSAYYAGGLKPDQVIRAREEVDRFNADQSGFKVFFGMESDILADGSLDYDESILKILDFVIASVHSQFSMKEAEMTRRIGRALENPYTTMLGHPTGRLLLSRDGYAVDMERIIHKAAETGVIIEINASPHRLDLDWRFLLLAKRLGVRIAINPDAHNTHTLGDLFYAIPTARKGWIEKEDVLNTLSVENIDIWLSERKKQRTNRQNSA